MEPSTAPAPVTFLFTDVARSTQIWEARPDQMALALTRHDAIAQEIIAAHGGTLVLSRGEGDSLFIVFDDARSAVATATELQLALIREPWPEDARLVVRMALHCGEADLRGNNYYGSAVNRAARLRSIAHPGQIVVSNRVRELAADVEFKLLGEHRLKDLEEPEIVFQVLHPELPADFGSLLSLNAQLGNLPAEISSFVGRAGELSQIARRLRESRLLTITGSGGCGKTRLGIRAARDAVDRFPDGVWLAELAPVGDPSLVPQTVAAALGVREPPGKTCTEALVAHLSGQRALILLDNCEHLLEGSARLVAALLSGCPKLVILATSREPLGIIGESTYRAPSLGLPRREGAVSVEEVTESEAVQLFLQRARLHRPDFQVDESTASTLASVCWRLDGIPFAIELAAARLRILSIEELNARLDQRFRLLVGGSKHGLQRQQTLRALIDWSFALLTPEEKLMLTRLSVFSGGFTLSAAEAVCSGPSLCGTHLDDLDILDLLESLVDKSLVMRDADRSPTRYGLLETVRHYSRESLGEYDDPLTVLHRHRDYYIEWAESLNPRYPEPAPAGALAPLDVEQDNIRHALAGCIEDPESGDRGLRLALAAGNRWIACGFWREIARALAALLDHPGAPEAWTMRGRAAYGLAALASGRGDDAEAHRFGTLSLSYFHSASNEIGTARALSALGTAETNLGRFDEARASLDQAIEILHRVGERRLLGHAVCGLGFLEFARGLDPGALEAYRDGTGILRSAGLDGDRLAWNNAVAALLFRTGDLPGAEALWIEALEVHGPAKDLPRIFVELDGLAMVASARGDLIRAAKLYGASQALSDRMGIDFFTAERPVRLLARREAEAKAGDAFQSDSAFGKAMPIEQAVRYALTDSLAEPDAQPPAVGFAAVGRSGA